MTIWYFLLLIGLFFVLGTMHVLLAGSNILQKREHSWLRMSVAFEGVLYLVFGIFAVAGLLVWIVIQIIGRLGGSFQT